jgi:uncharacterized RDD family membrane protein YckC
LGELEVEQDSVGSLEASPETQAASPLVLSSRVDRLLAIIVDVVIGLAVAAPVSLYTGAYDAVFHGQLTSSLYLEITLVSWGWYFLVNSYWLIKYGQTVGKRLLGIRISDAQTEAVPPFWRLLVRIAVPSFAARAGLIGSAFDLVDILLIFGKNRRCIHDLIAGTRVVDTWSRADI